MACGRVALWRDCYRVDDDDCWLLVLRLRAGIQSHRLSGLLLRRACRCSVITQSVSPAAAAAERHGDVPPTDKMQTDRQRKGERDMRRRRQSPGPLIVSVDQEINLGPVGSTFSTI